MANEVRRRGCIVAALVYVNPSVKPSVCQLPGRGAFNSLRKFAYSEFPAPSVREPFGVPLTKSCPRWRGKCHGYAVTKGVRLKTAECRELFPLSFAYAQQLPRTRWRLLVQYANSPY